MAIKRSKKKQQNKTKERDAWFIRRICYHTEIDSFSNIGPISLFVCCSAERWLLLSIDYARQRHMTLSIEWNGKGCTGIHHSMPMIQFVFAHVQMIATNSCSEITKGESEKRWTGMVRGTNVLIE